MRYRLFRGASPIFFVGALLGCTQFVDTAELNTAFGYAPRPARYTWMLPKTTVNASVQYRLVDCSDSPQRIAINPTITLSNTSEPDIDLGPDFPDGVVSIQTDDLRSFWNDSNLAVKTSSATHILSYLGAQPTSQTGAIVGSLIGSATKLTAVAFGVPAAAAPSAAPATPFCGKAKAVLEKIRELDAKLEDPAVTTQETKDIPSQISSLDASLTVAVDAKFFPGKRSAGVDPDSGRTFLGTLKPTLNQLKKTNWFADPVMAQKALDKKELQVDVYMDLKNAFPANSIKDALHCEEAGGKCTINSVPVSNGTLFREVAYIPVLAYQASDYSKPITQKTFPFGQFGAPRSLPVRAGLFEQLTWSLTFSDSGEITEANFTSKATGLALTSFISQASVAANSIATERRAEAVAVDPEVTRKQNENTALKAQIDNINYTQQLNALLAAAKH